MRIKTNCSAYLYDTNLRLYIIVINGYFGLFLNPFLDGICDVWYHWKREESTNEFWAAHFYSTRCPLPNLNSSRLPCTVLPR